MKTNMNWIKLNWIELCWRKSHVWGFLWKKIALISNWNDFQPNSYEEVCFSEEAYEKMQNIQILKILRMPSIRHQGVCFSDDNIHIVLNLKMTPINRRIVSIASF